MSRGLREHDLLAGFLGFRLAVGLAADHHVEHVDLAVDALDLAVGANVHGRVRELVAPVAQLGDRAGHEVDAELARDLARPVDRATAFDRLGALPVVVVRAENVELLGQHDERRTVGRGRSREPVGRRQVAVLVFRRVELYCSGPHAVPSL